MTNCMAYIVTLDLMSKCSWMREKLFEILFYSLPHMNIAALTIFYAIFSDYFCIRTMEDDTY